MAFEKEDPRIFFYEAICEALGRLRLQLESWTEFYLVDLLVRQVSRPVTQEPFVFQLEAAHRASSAKERFLRFKEMGDSALILVGFFEEAIGRRGVTRRYVINMGGGAYRNAASLSVDGLSQVYVTLSDGFGDFVRVLDEVREMTSLRTKQDVAALFEKWQRTGSITAADRLQHQGVFPVVGKPGSN